MQSTRKTEPRTVPELQKRLHYTGSDEVFKNYVLIALQNRGPVYSEIFKLYYGINCKSLDVLEICAIYPGCNVTKIRKLVLNRLEQEISEMITGKKKY